MRLSGFFDLSKLDDIEIKNLYIDCLHSSHHIVCESKYIKENRRVLDDKYSIMEMIDLVNTKCHNVFINRSIQHPHENHCEAGFKLNMLDWYQCSFFITLDRMEKIVEKYKLIML